MSSSLSNVSTGDGDGLNKVTYRATKLWLEALETFRTGVKLGKHRVLLRQYDRCFVAQDVVTWFHTELQNKFDVTMSREQTLHLLQKFYKAGVFTEVTNQLTARGSKSSTATIKETDFKDNKRLYKLVDYNPKDPNELKPNSSNENVSKESDPPNSDYYVVIKQLSMDQIYQIWEQAFVERFVQIVGYDVFTSFLKPGAVNRGGWILHNMTQISANGIVLAQNPSDELPSWIMNAMRCISRWRDGDPATDENGYPNYPGFEVDVFTLIGEYFNTFKESSPLLTFELHDAFITTFIRAVLFDVNNRLYVAKTGTSYQLGKKGLPIRRQFVQEEYPFSAAESESVENLLLDIFTPSPPLKEAVLRNNSKNRIPPRRLLGNVETFTDDIEPMPSQSYDIKKYSYKCPPLSKTPAEPVYLETAFTSERSPITRVISTSEIESSLGAFRKPSAANVAGNVTPPLKQQFAYENPLLQLSPADLINHPKYLRILRTSELGSTSKISSNNSFETSLLRPGTAEKSSPNALEFEFTRSLDQATEKKEPFMASRLYRRSQSAADLSDANRDRCPYVPRIRRGTSGKAPRESLLTQYASSPSRSARKTMEQFCGFTANAPSLMTSEGKNFAIVSFRLLTLLLPPRNRRYLQLLLRFMGKTAKNNKLQLDVGNTTRAIVINEFTRAILGCSVRKEYDEFLALQIVTFLMDNASEIFDVSKEDILKKAAEEQITEQQIEKIPSSGPLCTENKENSSAGFSRFSCARVSLDVYDDQRLMGSTAQSLRDLLSAWDVLEDVKERKKRLKKFRKEYPHIFAEKFGDGADAGGLESSTEKEQKKPRGILRSIF